MAAHPCAAWQVAEKLVFSNLLDLKNLQRGKAVNSTPGGTDYKPIACANYDQYEIAIMHGSKMHLTWQAGNVTYDQVVTPLTLRTAQGEEYLGLRLASGETMEVRLDHIRRSRIL
jgi:transcriptional antiterminator Rof (Rho-off)